MTDFNRRRMAKKLAISLDAVVPQSYANSAVREIQATPAQQRQQAGTLLVYNPSQCPESVEQYEAAMLTLPQFRPLLPAADGVH